MTDELFRKEVLDARRQSWLGSVHLVTSKMGWPIAFLGAAAVLALILFLIFGQHTASERVPGQLMPAGGLLSISAPVSGVVVAVRVHEGEQVSAHQSILEISPDVDSPALDGGGLGQALAMELNRQRMLLEADLSDLERGTVQRHNALESRIAMLRRQLEITDTELTVRERQLDSAETLLERIAPLQELGQLSGLQYQQHEHAALEARARLQMTLLQRAETQQQLAETETQLARLPLDTAERRGEIERALSDVAQAAARNETQRTVVLRAPRDGRVSGLAFNPGQAVTERQRLLSLIPDNSALFAELWVPSRAVGLLEPGGRVAMRYHAFPYQRFGQHYGNIVEVAHSALAPDEVLARAGIRAESPVYRVLVAIEQQQVNHHGRSYPLRPNMTLDADLLLQRQRLYQMVFAPADAGTGGSP